MHTLADPMRRRLLCPHWLMHTAYAHRRCCAVTSDGTFLTCILFTVLLCKIGWQPSTTCVSQSNNRPSNPTPVSQRGPHQTASQYISIQHTVSPTHRQSQHTNTGRGCSQRTMHMTHERAYEHNFDSQARRPSYIDVGMRQFAGVDPGHLE